jgi:hypothetical protein
MDEEIRKVRTQLTVPVWPTTGRVLGLGKNATYDAVKRGDIPTIRIGSRIVVPTAPLKKLLGLETGAAA